MAANPKKRYTEAEYLAMEAESDIKHEYHAGDIVAMTGASYNHIRVTSALIRTLEDHLDGTSCEVYPGEMRVRVAATQRYFYPDCSVVCDPPELHEDKTATLLNPILVIEVLSDSTEGYDRGKKFLHYQRIPSLSDYVLVAQDEPLIQCFSRGSDGMWTLTQAFGLDASITLPSIGCTLALADVYKRVTFEDQPEQE